ncbi:hypothetical protein BP00DRAFT_446265 [Aspergillus indologenus CBS 114.80]|uniref:Uncharacterized protein n=1 Tax=Aspergillus indologenus CBS 114.80 TaxID=1450541 RepID=A0A2V5I6J8_9EURO|nr:hypothetical protein BP00DRAFT_446265 [Aspergillus indologenus CBS 114.80]
MGPLNHATSRGEDKNSRKGMVELLLERGAGVDIRSREGMTPLVAAGYGGHERIKRLHYAAQGDEGAEVLYQTCAYLGPDGPINRRIEIWERLLRVYLYEMQV